ncbi:MAG: ABC transporter ATP-binding protein [Syntrophobacteria bacterium]
MSTSALQLVDLTKRYGKLTVVSQVNVSIERGEFFSLVGPSGSGKTTILRMIAGLTTPTSGSILLDGKEITGLPPEQRGLGLVFQNYAIFPHLDVYDNVAFGLRLRKVSEGDVGTKVHDLLDRVGLLGCEKKYPHHLSGGEQQRVALARAVAPNPKVLLLDEPLSALDKNLREEMKFWLRSFQEDLRTTTMYVTHDQSEALSLSDHVLVLNGGRVEQIGTPQEIYESPASMFVADFMGLTNRFSGTVTAIDDNRVQVRLTIGFDVTAIVSKRTFGVGQPVNVFVKPEAISVMESAATTASTVNSFEGSILQSSYEGALLRHKALVGGHQIDIYAINRSENRFSEGSKVRIYWAPTGVVVIGADDNERVEE